MKFLGITQVPQEIIMNQFKGVVANIAVVNCLGFSDNDLPPKMRAHNKALHISIECVDIV